MGGSCSWTLYTCTYRSPTQPQDNWLFSQYISYRGSNEAYFNVSYQFTRCRDSTRCQDDFVTLYRYDVNDSVSMTDQMNQSNYVPLFDGEPSNSHLQQLPSPARAIEKTLPLLRPKDSKGFYLGVHDSGTCGSVNRLIVYCPVCRAKQSELVVYPKIYPPPKDEPTSVFYAKCVPNAHNVTSLGIVAKTICIDEAKGEASCLDEGVKARCIDEAEGGARCECDAGYQISEDRLSCLRKLTC